MREKDRGRKRDKKTENSEKSWYWVCLESGDGLQEAEKEKYEKNILYKTTENGKKPINYSNINDYYWPFTCNRKKVIRI